MANLSPGEPQKREPQRGESLPGEPQRGGPQRRRLATSSGEPYGANVGGADLTGRISGHGYGTIFADVDLSAAKGLETVDHRRPVHDRH